MSYQTKTNSVTSLLYWLSHTDFDVVEKSSNAAKTNRTIIGSILFFCFLLAYVSAFYFIYLATSGSILGASIGGFIYGGIVLTLSQLVFKSKKVWVLVIRAIIIIIFSIFTALPIKLMCLHSTLSQNIEQDVFAYNQKLKKNIVGSVEQSFKSQLHLINNSLADAMENAAPIELISELQKRRKATKVEQQIAIGEAQNSYNTQKKKVVADFLGLYMAYFKLLTNRNNATNMAVFSFSWIALVVIIIVEISPIIVHVVLSFSPTDYDIRMKNKAFLMGELLNLQSHISYVEMMQASGNVDKNTTDKYASMTPKELATMKVTFNRLLNDLQNNYQESSVSFQAYEQNNNGVALESEYRN